MHYTFSMKSASIRSVRVEPRLCAAVESLFSDGETVSEFVEASVGAAVLRRRNQAGFIAGGLRSPDDVHHSGDYVKADTVSRKLQRTLDAARIKGLVPLDRSDQVHVLAPPTIEDSQVD